MVKMKVKSFLTMRASGGQALGQDKASHIGNTDPESSVITINFPYNFRGNLPQHDLRRVPILRCFMNLDSRVLP